MVVMPNIVLPTYPLLPPRNLPVLDNCRLRTLPNADYTKTHSDMLSCILDKIKQKQQGNKTSDELWLVEHTDVYTLGQAGKKEHILQYTNTPIIQTDRGGQVTWHGTGQLVVYFLFDIKALGWGVRDLVSHAEQAIEDTVNAYLPAPFTARAKKDAPGVYVYNQTAMMGKIASLGFKIKHGYSYHGIAINLTCDLSPFNAINPCGYAGMSMVKLQTFCPSLDTAEFTHALLSNISDRRQGMIALCSQPQEI